MINLVTPSQINSGDPVSISFDKEQLKAIQKIAESSVFSNEANWKLVSCVYKHDSSNKRIVSGSRNFTQEKNVSLKNDMTSGQKYELQKVIISKPDRTLMVLKRTEIQDVANLDFILK